MRRDSHRYHTLNIRNYKIRFLETIRRGAGHIGFDSEIIKYPVVLSSTKCYCDNFLSTVKMNAVRLCNSSTIAANDAEFFMLPAGKE